MTIPRLIIQDDLPRFHEKLMSRAAHHRSEQVDSEPKIEMRWRSRQILLVLLIGLYAAISLGGPGVHSLPGFDHNHASQATDHPLVVGGHDLHDGDAHTCPICHFHAQGQMIADPGDCRSIEVVWIRPLGDPPACSPPVCDRPSIPRAPPLA